MSDANEPEDKRKRGPSLRGAARRMMGDLSQEDGPLPRTRDLLGAVLSSSDKVKTEAVRMVGREVRTYLEGLGLDEAILHVMTHYSLEVNASFSLKPLADAIPPKEPASAPADEEEPCEDGEDPQAATVDD